MYILAIDPGPEKSAWMMYEPEKHTILPDAMHITDNKILLDVAVQQARHRAEGLMLSDCLAIEGVASYGMAVGASTFDTCVWIGRFIQAWSGPWTLLYRKRPNPPYPSICMHLCKNNRAKDANIRQALLDRFPATGGGKAPQIGTKKQPGPLYGVTSHLWSALAVAVTWADTQPGDIFTMARR